MADPARHFLPGKTKSVFWGAAFLPLSTSQVTGSKPNYGGLMHAYDNILEAERIRGRTLFRNEVGKCESIWLNDSNTNEAKIRLCAGDIGSRLL